MMDKKKVTDDLECNEEDYDGDDDDEEDVELEDDWDDNYFIDDTDDSECFTSSRCCHVIILLKLPTMVSVLEQAARMQLQNIGLLLILTLT